eukprot:s792_g6.t2
MLRWGVGRDLWDGRDRGGWVFPTLRVVPMGWSWAMFLSQRVLQHQAILGAGLSFERVLVDNKAAPDLSNGEPVILPYADNLNVAGPNQDKVQAAKDGAVSRLRGLGFIVHEEMDATDVAQSPGFLIDGKRGIVSPIPERLQKVILCFKWLSRRPRVTTKSMQKLLGHAVHFMMLRRELLSIPRSLYDFIQRAGCIDRRREGQLEIQGGIAGEQAKDPFELNENFQELPQEMQAGLTANSTHEGRLTQVTELKGSKRESMSHMKKRTGPELQGATGQERAQKRQRFLQQTPPIPRFVGQTRLEQAAVSQPVAKDYADRVLMFRAFVKERRLSIQGKSKFDSALCEFLNHMFEAGYDLSEATK